MNLLLTAIIIALPLFNIHILPLRGPGTRAGVSFVTLTVVGFLTLATLTWIEYLGIRFFAARRRWRLTPVAAKEICSHATVGWILSALFPLLLPPAMFALIDALNISHNRFTLRPGLPFDIAYDLIFIGGSLLLSYLSGLFAFEWLVYRGVRANRFANVHPPAHPTPIPAQSNTPHADSNS